MRHIARQQQLSRDLLSSSACRSGRKALRVTLRGRSGLRAPCGKSPPRRERHAREGSRANAAASSRRRRRGRSSLRYERPRRRPLQSDRRGPRCARQAAGRASAAAKPRPSLSLWAVAAGRPARSLRSACGSGRFAPSGRVRMARRSLCPPLAATRRDFSLGHPARTVWAPQGGAGWRSYAPRRAVGLVFASRSPFAALRSQAVPLRLVDSTDGAASLRSFAALRHADRSGVARSWNTRAQTTPFAGAPCAPACVGVAAYGSRSLRSCRHCAPPRPAR
jgi:hypothetical protein